jgi:hypothetical protein
LDVKKEYFKLEQGRDTLWDTADFEFVEDSAIAMTYYIKRTFKYDERYRLLMDSALLYSVYGHCNGKMEVNFMVKSEKDYGHLFVTVEGLSTPAFMELLNNSGSTVRQTMVKDGIATFMNMPPDKYYARITLDANGNGKWDAGNYEEKRQPERVIYFMKQFEILQNWKIEETWNISTAKAGEKPEELIKNKPKEKANKKRDYRDESRPRGGSSSSSTIRGLPF